MNTPAVSVIIPSFNREALIGETLRNLLAQTLAPREIIVVDDGSSDNTVRVVRSFGSRVRLIEQANQGPGAARNAGLRAAQFDYIQFQDSDDLYSLNKLEVQGGLLQETGADIAVSPWVKVWLEKGAARLEDHVLQQALPPSSLPLTSWWLRGWSTVFQSLLFRRSFLSGVGFYRTDLRLGEDGEFFFRALTRAPRIVFAPEGLTLYRLHEDNKLTEGDATRSRRVIDWVRCLQSAMAQGESVGLTPDFVTRLLLECELAKQNRYLLASGGAPSELLEFLARQNSPLGNAVRGVTNLTARVAERYRLWRRGSRWLSAFQATPPTPDQVRLIEQLGLAVHRMAPENHVGLAEQS
jgi:glycosyltransferase involved in cell wall biosynthesis